MTGEAQPGVPLHVINLEQIRFVVKIYFKCRYKSILEGLFKLCLTYF